MLTIAQQYEAKGMAEGVAKGMAEGVAKGMAETLTRLLRRRFGALPPAAHDRITQASPQQLGDWAERVLDAPSLDAVFGDETRH